MNMTRINGSYGWSQSREWICSKEVHTGSRRSVNRINDAQYHHMTEMFVRKHAERQGVQRELWLKDREIENERIARRAIRMWPWNSTS